MSAISEENYLFISKFNLYVQSIALELADQRIASQLVFAVNVVAPVDFSFSFSVSLISMASPSQSSA